MKFLAIMALAASAAAVAVNKRGGEWNTWQAVTVYVTTTDYVTTTATDYEKVYVTTTCYETITDYQTTTEVSLIHYLARPRLTKSVCYRYRVEELAVEYPLMADLWRERPAASCSLQSLLPPTRSTIQ